MNSSHYFITDNFYMIGTNIEATNLILPSWNMYLSIRYNSNDGGIFTDGTGLRSDNTYGKAGIYCFKRLHVNVCKTLVLKLERRCLNREQSSISFNLRSPFAAYRYLQHVLSSFYSVLSILWNQILWTKCARYGK